MDAPDAPEPRVEPGLVALDGHVLVWGGWNHPSDSRDIVPVNSGGVYDPEADRWTPTPEDGAPSPRWEHVLVDAGTFGALVWGGTVIQDDRPTRTHDGARLDLATERWIPISQVDAPPGGRGVRGVWTGEELLAWSSAESDAGTQAVGGRYDPATDRWRPMSMVDAPRGFEYAGVVWAGPPANRMVVWGGRYFIEDTGVISRTGATYDPANDRWTPMPAPPIPLAGDSPAIVWTGAEVIIWGGAVVSDQQTGARYDPLTNTWRTISMTNVPPRRNRAGAVWTGREMIVWGGGSDDTYDTGGRYDPARDTWSPLPPGPTGRWFLGMAWLSPVVVLFGGSGTEGVRSDHWLFVP